MYNKRGGILGRPVTLIDADDASNVQTAIAAATKMITEDRVDILMGTFNGEVALAVADLARQHDKLFMVTGAHAPELTGSHCDSHTFVFMPSANDVPRRRAAHRQSARNEVAHDYGRYDGWKIGSTGNG